MKKNHGLDPQRTRILPEQKMVYFRRFWVKEPRHSENNIITKSCYPYIVACVLLQI